MVNAEAAGIMVGARVPIFLTSRADSADPVKAALEASTRYLAAELGPKGIRVHAISPGPIRTRAASGIDRFDELMEKAAAHAPSRMLVSIEDVGMATAFLATDFARLMTGDTVYIDGGYHVVS
jgi:enoyl-[acyl-carrier protein] reductase I